MPYPPDRLNIDFNAVTGTYVATTDFDTLDSETGSLPVFIGPIEIGEIYFGSAPIQEIWLGSTKLWPGVI